MKIKLLDTFLADGFYLTQEYGTNKYIDYTQWGLLYHEGVDFGHSNKTKEIRCVNGGECLTAYDNAYGRYVIVLDYNLLCATWYCHLSKATISSGQRVKAGDVIGNMGSTGNSTGSHLHFNFVIINSSGNRLYKDYPHNQGYLDPLYPRDPSTPKKMGIDYDIDWVKTLPESLPMPETIEQIYKHFGVQNFEELKVWKETQEKNMESDRNKVKELQKQIDEHKFPEVPDYGDATDPHWIKLYEILERKLG